LLFFAFSAIIGDWESSRNPGNLSMGIGKGLIGNTLFHTDRLSIFHILDSLGMNPLGKEEAKRLQNIFLKYFEGETFKEGRIATNVPRVHLISFSSQIIIDPSDKRCPSSLTAMIAPVSQSILQGNFSKSLIPP
jgi:hypothetical protein